MPVVYDQLRRLAGSFLGPGEVGTIDATEVVHEAYLRLMDSDAEWRNRARFYAFAARLMRNILVDFARQRHSQKRGGQLIRVTLDRLIDVVPTELASDRLLALDEALERLAQVAPRPARVVELHYFGGLDYDQTAEILEVSKTTVNRDLRVAKAWLRKELKKAA